MNAKRIILAGGSGFLGRALATHFRNMRYEIVILTRSPKTTRGPIREVAWDARTLGGWASEFEGATAIINLTGRSVDCRYHAKNRKEIMESRVDSTKVVGEAIAKCKQPPAVWLNASTATIYKHTFDRPNDELTHEIKAVPEAKDAFSVEVATEWEQTFNAAETPYTRKVALRTAMVLGYARNSVFPMLRRLARLGLGGKMGCGKQFVSFIHEVDFCRAVEWIIEHEKFSFPVNVCAPNPLPNKDMMRIVREVCGVPFGLPATEWMLEVGAIFLRTETELIIKSRRVVPKLLLESGFQFRFPTFRSAVEDLVAKAK